jgi:hypothetical protein
MERHLISFNGRNCDVFNLPTGALLFFWDHLSSPILLPGIEAVDREGDEAEFRHLPRDGAVSREVFAAELVRAVSEAQDGAIESCARILDHTAANITSKVAHTAAPELLSQIAEVFRRGIANVKAMEVRDE